MAYYEKQSLQDAESCLTPVKPTLQEPTTLDEAARESSPRGTTTDETKRRSTFFVDISERKDLNSLIPVREVLTSDLDAYDSYIDHLKHEVVRSEEDPPFNEYFWSHTRKALEHAVPVGYNELDEEGSCQLKTYQDAMRIFSKYGEFCHLVPIYPNIIADVTGCSIENVLAELFYATKIGLVDMVFSPDCVRCGGSVCRTNRLGDVPDAAICEGCGLKNVVSSLDAIKVYFVFKQEVFYFPVKTFECMHSISSKRMSKLLFKGAAFPTSTKSGFSYQFGQKGKNSQPELLQGLYRISCPYSSADCYLQVESDATDNEKPIVAKLKVSEMLRPQAGAKRSQFSIPHGRVRFDMYCDTNSTLIPHFFPDMDDEEMFYVPEHERKPFTSATTCIHHPSFKKLFEKQIVSDASSFTVKRVVLVFTDVVGSTALYESCGDGVALETVKQHFKVLFAAFTNSGRVVKTVGDCVMAAFTSSGAAISAVATGLENIQQECLLPDGKPLSIRVGMHSGQALMVALNGINDYFGSTVNVAARVESKAVAHECLVTDAVLSEPGAAAAFKKVVSKGLFVHSRDVELSLKGVDHLVQAKGFKIKSETRD